MYHILIVEDEPKIASFMQKGLHQAGYQAVIVGDGPSALAEAATGHYQLILLDLGLPGLDGQAVLQSLRSQGNTCPVLVVTARTRAAADNPALQELANGWIQKPFRMKELLHHVQRLLSS